MEIDTHLTVAHNDRRSKMTSDDITACPSLWVEVRGRVQFHSTRVPVANITLMVFVITSLDGQVPPDLSPTVCHTPRTA
jgi:hypothetical protein